MCGEFDWNIYDITSTCSINNEFKHSFFINIQWKMPMGNETEKSKVSKYSNRRILDRWSLKDR